MVDNFPSFFVPLKTICSLTIKGNSMAISIFMGICQISYNLAMVSMAFISI